MARIIISGSLRKASFNSGLRKAGADGVAATVSVVKSNPARRLYERLGFALTHEDKRKAYVRREIGGRAS